MVKTVLPLNIFVETDTFYLSGFFNEEEVQKNSIYLEYKCFVAL